MKLVDAYNVESLYSKMSSRTDLSVASTYKLLKFFNKLKVDADFYREKLVEILNDYAERDDTGKAIVTENGQKIQIQPDKLEECEQKLQELAEIEIQEPEITFTLNEIPEGLSVQEFNLLMPFIKE